MRINKDETYNDFLRRLRARQKLTQEEFALRLGFTASTISRWENGAKIPYFSQRVIDDYAKRVK